MDRLTYNAAIDHLKQTDPSNMWIPELEGKYSFINTRYLKDELNRIDQASPKKEVRSSAKKKVRNPDTNPILRDLFKQRTKVFNQRSKTSNKFHICKTDEDRAAVSDEIQVLQKKWQALTSSIQQYEETGQMPETADKYPIPKSPLERHRKRNSLRSQRSNKRAEIKRHAQALSTTTNAEDKKKLQKKIDKAESKLKDTETYLAYVEAAIQD